MPRQTDLNKPQAMRNAPLPPPYLQANAKALWRETITARPAAEWCAADCTLLALYVGAALDVRRLNEQIARDGEVIEGRISPLVQVRAGRENLLLAVAKKLKLTPCSRYTAKDVGRLHRHAGKALQANEVLDSDDLLAGHSRGLQ